MIVKSVSERHVTTWGELIRARLDGLEAGLLSVDDACPLMYRVGEIKALCSALRADIDRQEESYRGQLAQKQTIEIPSIWLNWAR